jgi:hypothetical protein
MNTESRIQKACLYSNILFVSICLAILFVLAIFFGIPCYNWDFNAYYQAFVIVTVPTCIALCLCFRLFFFHFFGVVQAVCTEAGMFALRERRVHVTQEDFEMAVAKVMKKDTEKNMSLRKLWK